MQLSPDAVFFEANDGCVIVYGDRDIYPLLFSRDGQTFFELKNDDFVGTFAKHILHYYDPHTAEHGVIERDGNTIEMGHVPFNRVAARSVIEVMQLPILREPAYLLRWPGNTELVYVSRDRLRDPVESLKLFVGHGRHLEETAILDAQVLSDGETLIRALPKDVLSIWVGSPESQTRWNEMDLEILDTTQYSIWEGGAKVQIRNLDEHTFSVSDPLSGLDHFHPKTRRRWLTTADREQAREILLGITCDGIVVVVDEFGSETSPRFLVHIETLDDLLHAPAQPLPVRVVEVIRLAPDGPTMLKTRKGTIYIPQRSVKIDKPPRHSLDGKVLKSPQVLCGPAEVGTKKTPLRGVRGAQLN